MAPIEWMGVFNFANSVLVIHFNHFSTFFDDRVTGRLKCQRHFWYSVREYVYESYKKENLWRKDHVFENFHVIHESTLAETEKYISHSQ